MKVLAALNCVVPPAVLTARATVEVAPSDMTSTKRTPPEPEPIIDSVVVPEAAEEVQVLLKVSNEEESLSIDRLVGATMFTFCAVEPVVPKVTAPPDDATDMPPDPTVMVLPLVLSELPLLSCVVPALEKVRPA